MPEYWFNNKAKPHSYVGYDDAERIFNLSISAANKPYFMVYVYPSLHTQLNKFIKDNNSKARRIFRKYNITCIDDIINFNKKTEKMKTFLEHYNKGIKLGYNPCVVNRICWIFEREFKSFSVIYNGKTSFDYSIMKSNAEYSRKDYSKIYTEYKKYCEEYNSVLQSARLSEYPDEPSITTEEYVNKFKKACYSICSNQYELMNIILDLCYRTENSKRFAWDIVGDVIVENLLEKNNYILSYPEIGGEEFEYNGKTFTMKSICLNGETDGNS